MKQNGKMKNWKRKSHPKYYSEIIGTYTITSSLAESYAVAAYVPCPGSATNWYCQHQEVHELVMCVPVWSSHVRQPTPTQSVAGIQDRSATVLMFIAAASKSFSTISNVESS